MSISAGPNSINDGLIFHIDFSLKKNFNTGIQLINSINLSGGSFAGYCGPLTNVTYNTNDVQAPDGTYTATKIVRNDISSCFGSGAVSRGIYWNNSSTIQANKFYTNTIYARSETGSISLLFGITDGNQNTYNVTSDWTLIRRTAKSINTSRGLQIITNELNRSYYIWSGVLQNSDNIVDNIRFINGYVYDNIIFNSGYISLDGINDFIVCDDDSLTDFKGTTEEFSICSWFKIPLNHTKNTIGSLYDRQRYGLNYRYNTNSFYLYYVDKRQEDSGVYNQTEIPITSAYITKGIWNFIVATYKKNGDGAIVNMYINGNLVNNSSLQHRITNGYHSTVPQIGNSSHLGGTYYYLEGDLASISIYDKVLSESEVKQNFESLRGRFGL